MLHLLLVLVVSLVVVGVVLFIIGLNASNSVADRMSNFFTGQYTDSVVWYMLGGGAARPRTEHVGWWPTGQSVDR
ncbi:MAG: DUF3185 family protein [Phycisphaeraceae bacterium]